MANVPSNEPKLTNPAAVPKPALPSLKGLKRKAKVENEEEIVEVTHSVSQGPLDKVVDYAFNPSREKIREVTIIDPIQARLLPQLDLINDIWSYVIQIAIYRKDSVEYERIYQKKEPVSPDLIDDFIYRTAQWQKSAKGLNLEKLADIALAETESGRNDDQDYLRDRDGWKE